MKISAEKSCTAPLQFGSAKRGMEAGKEKFFLVMGPYVLLIEFASFQAVCQMEVYLLAREMKSPLMYFLPSHRCKRISENQKRQNNNAVWI